jgi:hypothetical protein
MALDIGSILDLLLSHAAATGWFDSVNDTKIDEPLGASQGMTIGIWNDDIQPVHSSGLSSTSVRITFKARLFSSTEAAPEGYLERAMVDAASALMNAYSGDFDLGGEARAVDLLGMHGVSLSCNAHYMNLSGIVFRVFDITIPVIVNDVWTQTA